MSARQIGERLGRSKSEIFRMVYVLVDRGYLRRDTATDQLSLSNRLFELGMRTPRSRALVAVAVPKMERLSLLVSEALGPQHLPPAQPDGDAIYRVGG